MDAAAPIVAIEPSTPERNIPAIGAALAATIALFIAVVGGALKPDDQGWLLGVLGVPVTTILAWRTAPRVVAETTKRGIAMRAVGLGVRTIVFTETAILGTVVTVATLFSLLDPDGQSLVGVGFLVVYGLVAMVVGGLVVAVIVIPAAFVWAALLRIATR